MDHDVPTYRRNFSTTLALGFDSRGKTAGTLTGSQPCVIPADEVFGDSDEPLLTLGASVHVLPVDKGSFVKYVFFLFGIIVMLPTVYLMTASDYWMYKFRNVTAGPHVNPKEKTALQANFFAAFGVFTNVPALATICVTVMFAHRVEQRTRNFFSLCAVAAIFIMLTVFVEVDTDSWQYGFFVLVMVALVVLNVFGTGFQGGIIGLASLLPPEYMHSSVIGMAVGGLLASFLQILSISWHSNPTNAGLVYLGFGTALLVAGLFGFLAIQRTEFFQFYLQNPAGSRDGMITYEDIGVHVSLMVLFRRVWREAVALLLVLCITQCVFPAVTALVVSQDVNSGSAWSGRFFIPVCSYFLYSAGDVCGRIVSSYVPLGDGRANLILLLSGIRVAFIPLILLCNALPRNHLPIVFENDAIYIALVTMLGLSNGYLLSSAMILAPKKVESYLQERTGTMMTGFLLAGLALGSVLSVIVVKIL